MSQCCHMDHGVQCKNEATKRLYDEEMPNEPTEMCDEHYKDYVDKDVTVEDIK